MLLLTDLRDEGQEFSVVGERQHGTLVGGNDGRQ